MKYLLKTLLIVPLIMLTGCDSDTSGDSDALSEGNNNTITANDPDINTAVGSSGAYQGDWESRCILDDSEPNDIQYIKLELSIDGSSLERRASVYIDGECSELSSDSSIEVTRIGDLEIGPGSTTTSLGEADHILIDYDRTVFVVDGETLDTVVSEENDVTYDIWLLTSDGDLYIGDQPEEPNTEETRPTVLDLVRPLRQNNL